MRETQIIGQNVSGTIFSLSGTFQKFGKPHSTVNTIRFVLNCAYGLELPYLDIIHYNVDLKTNSIAKFIF